VGIVLEDPNHRTMAVRLGSEFPFSLRLEKLYFLTLWKGISPEVICAREGKA
jgi:hypothetical protein